MRRHQRAQTDVRRRAHEGYFGDRRPGQLQQYQEGGHPEYVCRRRLHQDINGQGEGFGHA